MKLEFNKQFFITQRQKGYHELLLGADLTFTKKK